MILDKLLQFDPAATAASAIVTGGVDSSNIIDLLNARDMSIGDEHRIEVVFTIGTVFAASGGAASLTIRIYGSADNSTYRLLIQSDAIPKANLTANSVIRLPLPSMAANPLMSSIPRYIKCNYIATTNAFTSGDFECDLVVDPQSSTPPVYPAGITVAN